MAKKDKAGRVKLILNSAAGVPSESINKLDLISDCLKENGLKVDVTRLKGKSKAALEARKAVKSGYQVVVAMGGDGTVEAVMRGLIGSRTRLGIVPVGNENGIARSLGIPTDLRQACQLIATGAVRDVDIAEVKTPAGKWLPFFEMVGIGYTDALASPEDLPYQLELPQTPTEGAAASSQAKPAPMARLVFDDGREVEVNTHLVTVSNSPVTGGKHLAFSGETPHAGLLDISVFQDFTRTGLREYYREKKNGGYPENGTVQRYRAKRVKLSTSPPMKVVVDGAKLGKGRVSLKMHPAAVRVIASADAIAEKDRPQESWTEQLRSFPVNDGNSDAMPF